MDGEPLATVGKRPKTRIKFRFRLKLVSRRSVRCLDERATESERTVTNGTIKSFGGRHLHFERATTDLFEQNSRTTGRKQRRHLEVREREREGGGDVRRRRRRKRRVKCGAKGKQTKLWKNGSRGMRMENGAERERVVGRRRIEDERMSLDAFVSQMK
jgi:hypothetical protein